MQYYLSNINPIECRNSRARVFYLQYFITIFLSIINLSDDRVGRTKVLNAVDVGIDTGLPVLECSRNDE